MNLIDKILELFRKKEYYSVGYETLNTFNVFFKEINDDNLDRIKEIITGLKEAENIADNKTQLLEQDTICYSELAELLENIKAIIHQDYRQTYFEAINE